MKYMILIHSDMQFWQTLPEDEVNRVLDTKKEKTVIIKADRAVDYGAVMEAMDSLRMGGIEDMGLITGQPAKRTE